jgi:D-arabinose 1-dehydrogenase-like Zn-dependent alcohol dehydrogenase
MVSYEQAAPIFCACYTVWSGLRWADPPAARAGCSNTALAANQHAENWRLQFPLR